MRFRLVQKSMTLEDDLELLKVQIFTEFCANSHIWEAPTAKRMKIDPYYQRQKCSPMTLGSGNMSFMRIFGAGASNDSGVVDDGNFWRFGWLYFFGNVRDKASNITWRHATLCWPEIDCKINDLE